LAVLAAAGWYSRMAAFKICVPSGTIIITSDVPRKHFVYISHIAQPIITNSLASTVHKTIEIYKKFCQSGVDIA